MQQRNVSTVVIVQYLLLAKSFFQKDQTRIVLQSVTRNTEDNDTLLQVDTHRLWNKLSHTFQTSKTRRQTIIFLIFDSPV